MAKVDSEIMKCMVGIVASAMVTAVPAVSSAATFEQNLGVWQGEGEGVALANRSEGVFLIAVDPVGALPPLAVASPTQQPLAVAAPTPVQVKKKDAPPLAPVERA